jgi:hypothetical protein
VDSSSLPLAVALTPWTYCFLSDDLHRQAQPEGVVAQQHLESLFAQLDVSTLEPLLKHKSEKHDY